MSDDNRRGSCACPARHGRPQGTAWCCDLDIRWGPRQPILGSERSATILDGSRGRSRL